MTNKQRFLKQNIGFHFEDLSLMKQMELEAITNELGLSQEWVMLALSKDTLENWEKWGFNLFKKPDFRSEINNLLAVLNKMDESKFKVENKKNRDNQVIHISEKNFKYYWDGVIKQGRILTREEATAQHLDDYWTYNKFAPEELRIWANTIIASGEEPDEEDWVKFCLSVWRECKIKIPAPNAITPEEVPANG